MMPAPNPLLDVALLDGPVHARPFDPFPQPAGAECLFLGRTRHETHPTHGPLRRLSYECYRPMTQRILADLASRAIERYNCLAVRIHHAVGEVPVGEPSVLIQVVTGHRAPAFEACRFLIDQLKAEAPIWKREEWADGSTWSQGSPATPTSHGA